MRRHRLTVREVRDYYAARKRMLIRVPSLNFAIGTAIGVLLFATSFFMLLLLEPTPYDIRDASTFLTVEPELMDRFEHSQHLPVEQILRERKSSWTWRLILNNADFVLSDCILQVRTLHYFERLVILLSLIAFLHDFWLLVALDHLAARARQKLQTQPHSDVRSRKQEFLDRLKKDRRWNVAAELAITAFLAFVVSAIRRQDYHRNIVYGLIDIYRLSGIGTWWDVGPRLSYVLLGVTMSLSICTTYLLVAWFRDIRQATPDSRGRALDV